MLATSSDFYVATIGGFGEKEAKGVEKQRDKETDSTMDLLRQGGVPERRQQYIDGVGGLQVFSPRMPDHARPRVFSWSLTEPSFLLLASDGLTRMFDSYGLFASDEEFYWEIVRNGLQGSLSKLREYERNCSTKSDHFKAADDAITFDTTGVSIDEVVAFISEKANEILDK